MSKTLEMLRKEIGIAFDENDMSALGELVPALEAFNDPLAKADALRVRGKIAANDGDKATASTLYNRAIEIFREHGDDTSEALTMNDIGSMHHHAEDYQRALECYTAVIDRFNASGRDHLALYALHNRAMCLKVLGSVDRAYEAYQHCLALAQKHNEQSMVAMAHNGLARIHLDLSEYGLSIEHYNHALHIAESINSSKLKFTVHDGLGMVYTDIGEYPTALQHLHQARQIAEDTGHKRRSAQVSMSIANVYFDLNEHDTSRTWNERAVALYKELAEEYGEISAIENIANIHNARGDVDAAIPLYERVLEYCKSTHRDAHLASTLCNLTACYFNAHRYEDGRSYLDAADAIDVQEPTTLLLRKQLRAGLCKHEGDLTTATAILLECLQLSETFQLRPYAIDFHEDLREIALLNNDLAGYVLHNTRSTEIRNELNGVSTAQKIAAQETERKLAAERQERDKERAVLYSTLPKHIADRIVRGEQVTGDHYDNAAVIFVDIVGFTQISDQLSASDVVIFLERLFSQFDEICKRHGVTKIKTIGDSYMAVAFAEQPNNRITEQPNTSGRPNASDPAHRAASAALDIMRAVADFPSPVNSPEGSPASSPEGSPASSPKGSPKGSPEGSPVSVRLGLHCGAVTAGVIGTERLQYDVWGDTVNVASRLESTGEPGKIHVSEAFAQSLSAASLGLRPQNDRPHQVDSQQGKEGAPVIPSNSEERGTWHVERGTWHLALRGEIDLKGKGKMTTYWLEAYEPLPA